MRMIIRKFTGYIVAPIIAVTGFRFNKNYRWGTTAANRIVYKWVDVVLANTIADIIKPVN